MRVTVAAVWSRRPNHASSVAGGGPRAPSLWRGAERSKSVPMTSTQTARVVMPCSYRLAEGLEPSAPSGARRHQRVDGHALQRGHDEVHAGGDEAGERPARPRVRDVDQPPHRTERQTGTAHVRSRAER